MLEADNGCDAYTVAYYFGGKRVRKTFAELDLAKLEAETVADRICAGELNVLTLTSEDRTAYVRSMEMLKPLNTPLGTTKGQTINLFDLHQQPATPLQTNREDTRR